MDLAPLIAGFRRDLRAQRRSPPTIRNYELSIGQFCDWLEASVGRAHLADMTRENLKLWLLDAAGRWEASTTNTKIAGVRSFGRWLVDEEYLTTNPASNLPAPAVVEVPPEVLSDDQLRSILAWCNGRSFLERRDHAMAARADWYGHLPLALGIVMVGVGIEDLVLHPAAALPSPGGWVLSAGLALFLVGSAVILGGSRQSWLALAVRGTLAPRR